MYITTNIQGERLLLRTEYHEGLRKGPYASRMHKFRLLGCKQAPRWLTGHCRCSERNRICAECDCRCGLGCMQQSNYPCKGHRAHAWFVRFRGHRGSCGTSHRRTRGKETGKGFTWLAASIHRVDERCGRL